LGDEDFYQGYTNLDTETTVPGVKVGPRGSGTSSKGRLWEGREIIALSREGVNSCNIAGGSGDSVMPCGA
jgi:hypothetical protein